MTRRVTRRHCLASAGAVAAAIVVPAGTARGYAANERLDLGVIGVGGRGGANLNGVAGENIVSLCDVDRGHLETAARRFPKARSYTDFRKLLDAEKTLDGVVVSTPDHSHAPAAVPAMRRGMHCYCEKPLTYNVHEARVMAQVAAEKRLVTHMGTPSRGKESVVRAVEIIRAGALGEVVEAHFWTNRPIWPQGHDRPEGEDAIPTRLDWENWIGAAPMRPFKRDWPEGHPAGASRYRRAGAVYHPFVWRGWWDFGTGALGDIAPHSWHQAYWALNLNVPESVDLVDVSGPVTEMFPAWSILRFNFPATAGRPAVKLYWYDGGKCPAADVVGTDNVPAGGYAIVGTKATLGVGNKSKDDFPDVPKTMRRYGDMYAEWIAGIKNGDPDRPSCPFGYAGPLTEAYLLGNIALKLGQSIAWNAKAFRITGNADANRHLKRQYRNGWEIE